MASPSDIPIVLYHYDLSPFAKRVVWYLKLRKIPYSQCIQPRIMPRPDLNRLGVTHRRIPVLAIGRDVYLDTRLIIRKLETLYPPGTEHPGISGAHAPAAGDGGSIGRPEYTALEQLISARMIDGGLCKRFVQCMPAGTYSADKTLERDRAALNGLDLDKPGAVSPYAAETVNARRPEALADAHKWIRWLEEGLLADGRPWLLDSNAGGAGGPSLADLEAVWTLHWLSSVPGALPPVVLGAESAPKVSAWIQRFKDEIEAAMEAAPAASSLKGEEAARLIAGAPFAESEGDVLPGDPVAEALGLRKGDMVKAWPSDYGSSHKDAGKLVAMNDKEFVIETKGEFGNIRIHAPRHGFTICKDAENAASQT